MDAAKRTGRWWPIASSASRFYQNLHALMDEPIAEMMKEPKFRKMIQEFNVRMFEVMTEIARKHMSGHK